MWTTAGSDWNKCGHQGMGRCRYAPSVLSPHRFAAVPPVHEPRAATPSATHTLMPTVDISLRFANSLHVTRKGQSALPCHRVHCRGVSCALSRLPEGTKRDGMPHSPLECHPLIFVLFGFKILDVDILLHYCPVKVD